MLIRILALTKSNRSKAKSLTSFFIYPVTKQATVNHELGFVSVDIVGGNSLWYILNHTKKGGRPMQAYSMKCRAKKEMKNAKSITMKNGKPATQGVCPTCGTKMFKISKG